MGKKQKGQKPIYMLTVADAAELLGVSSSTLRNWDRAGKLKARRHPMNGYRLYEKAEILVLREAIANYGPSGTDEPSGGKHEDDNSRK